MHVADAQEQKSGRWKLAALPAADDLKFDAQLMRVIARANGGVGRGLAAAGSPCFLQLLDARQVPDLPYMVDSGRTAIASVGLLWLPAVCMSLLSGVVANADHLLAVLEHAIITC